MRSASWKLYAPFIALIAIQGLVVTLAPSTGPTQDVSALGGEFDPGATGTGSGGSGGDFDPDAGGGDFGGDLGTGAAGTGGAGGTTGSGGTSGGTGTGTSGSGTGGGTGGGGTGGTGGGGEQAAGDTSHCTPDGRQHGVIYQAPACKPKFAGDNGGATYQGVTGETIKVISFASQPNEQVDAILAREGLAASKEEERAFREAAVEFVNKHYETYGREIEVTRVVGDCPTTPPAPDKCRQAASEVVQMEPFMVIWGTSLYDEVFDVFARAGVVSVGGNHFADPFFNDRRPFRYDIMMDGTSSAQVIAEYYCKKLAGKGASNAGRVIHRDIGGRETQRKLGIITPEIPANVANAQLVQRLVKDCDDGRTPFFSTYASDINRAEEQTRATVAGLIENKVTTVVCMCDPIAPVFLTNGLTRNNYFPENLMPGLGLLDFDKLGRLYDPAQWDHAFGPSHLAQPVPHSESDATKIWRDVGRQGEPCQSCNLAAAYYVFMGTLIQNAGPDLNPITMERGTLTAEPRGGWEQTQGNPTITLSKFGVNDYTALSDFREVYWDASARSVIDGRPGAYVNIDGGRRYEKGQLSNEFKVPAKAQ